MKCIRSFGVQGDKSLLISEIVEKLWTASRNESQALSLLNVVHPVSASAIILKILQDRGVPVRNRSKAIRTLENMIGQNWNNLYYSRVYANLVAEDLVRVLSQIIQEPNISEPLAIKHGDPDSFSALKSRAAILLIAVLWHSENYKGNNLKIYEIQENEDYEESPDSDDQDDDEPSHLDKYQSTTAGQKLIENKTEFEKVLKEAKEQLKKVEKEDREKRMTALKALHDMLGYKEKKIFFEERNNSIQITRMLLVQQCLQVLQADVAFKISGDAWRKLTFVNFNFIKDVSNAIKLLAWKQQYLELLWGAKMFQSLTDILKSNYGTEDTIYANTLESLALLLNFAISQKGQGSDSTKSELAKVKKTLTPDGDIPLRIKTVKGWSASDSFPMSNRSDRISSFMEEALQNYQSLETKEKDEANESPPAYTRHIMMSYNHAQREKADKLVAALERLNLRVWIDHKGTDFVPPMMEEIDDQMARAVEESFCVICLISPEYCKSENCKREVQEVLHLKLNFMAGSRFVFTDETCRHTQEKKNLGYS